MAKLPCPGVGIRSSSGFSGDGIPPFGLEESGCSGDRIPPFGRDDNGDVGIKGILRRPCRLRMPDFKMNGAVI